MNTPNPLVPQGSLERQSKGKSTVRIAIFTIVSIHAVFFAGLLMQGCRRDDGKSVVKTAEAATNQNTLPALDSGYYPGTQEVAQTQTPSALSSTPSAGTTASPEPIPNLPSAITPSELAPEGKTYTVAKGDTLSKIARAHHVTIAALTKANLSVDLAKPKPGMKIQIPAPTAAAATPTATATAGIGFKEPSAAAVSTGTVRIHSVKAGETLTKIAKQTGSSVKAIRAMNSLKSDHLFTGQKLKLPAAHVATTSTAAAKPISKMTATNPAHISPVAATGSNAR